MNTSETVAELFAAISEAQAEMGGAVKAKENKFFSARYADLSSVLQVIKKPLADHGLALIQAPGLIENYAMVTTRIVHKSGEWLETVASAPMSKNDVQALGAVTTYLRRYSCAALFSIPQVDSDAEAAMLRPVVETITDNTARMINAMLEDTNADRAAFLSLFDSELVESIPLASGQRALAMLRSKKAAQDAAK